jgi:Skp family chaperone for outer membrane proteins
MRYKPVQSGPQTDISFLVRHGCLAMTRCFVVCCALLLSLPASLVFAQSQNPQAAAGTRVALLDLGHILRNHPGYTAKREALKEKAKALSGQETNIRKQLQNESEKLKEFQPGSPDFKKHEADLAQHASDFQLQVKLQRRELVEEEAKILYETYNEVQAVVDRLSQSYGFSLVIRFERDRMEPTDPDSISRGLMNPVVYHRNLDITDLVLQELKGASTADRRAVPSNRPAPIGAGGAGGAGAPGGAGGLPPVRQPLR